MVYDALDANNVLDYLTMAQITYSTPHEWIAYGFAFNYNDKRYESVSRYYFDTMERNQSKMLPVSYGIRPGEPMDPLPDGVTQYNPDNVHWVVVHDTANTSAGAGALSHANYLYNAALAGTELWVSWHFTIDHEEIYQHLPLDERGYHAGDGSTQPGTNDPYFGGGNRNGIGIEMSVQQDGDTMRTWQRTAKLVVELLLEYNLPLDHMTYHNDFSGKDCPNTLRNAGLIPLFEEFAATEYHMATMFPGAEITFTSHNPEFLDNHGRVIAMPDRAMTVSYTITVTYDGTTESRTFYTYLPGTIR
jgi:N-acetylmuramoyl-L-alanine amidase